MKKLLIIQKDEAYFLFETLQVLEKNSAAFKDYDVTVLVDEQCFKSVQYDVLPIVRGITTDEASVLSTVFDYSFNLSLTESSWDLHDTIKSERKNGFHRHNGELIIDDLWSTYLLTLKSRAPYLTFHLQDVYKNILGIKGVNFQEASRFTLKQIAFGTASASLFSPQEQDNFLTELTKQYPGIPVKDISEIDLVEDVTNCLYIGPSTLDSLKFAEAGGKCVFLTGSFQGFNLLPYSGKHSLLSSRGSVFRAGALLKFLEQDLREKTAADCPYSIYKLDNETSPSSYLHCVNNSDDSYPFYQTHFVLWNFLLSLSDVDLEISKCSESQINLLKTQNEVLTKFIRLHDYAISSVDTIHAEAKSSSANAAIIDGHIKNLQDIERISDQIAASHPLLRPFLDFYRVRRGQNFGSTLMEQARTSFLTYAEEHEALKALQELFSVTLKKNEVNI